MNTTQIKDKIYYYKNGSKMEPIIIAAEDRDAWKIFCQNIARQHPQDPHPYWSDVVEFRKQRAIQKHT